ncbi:MAG: protein translocase subunit SecD [Breznakia sp.]
MNKKKLVVFGASVVILLTSIIGFGANAINNMNLGLDLKGGFEVLYEITPLEGSEAVEIDMAAVASAVSKRVDVLGVSEPEITIEGDRVRVQLAGVSNSEEARNIISSSAVLTFRDTSDNLLMDATVLQDGGASLIMENGSPAVQLKIANTEKFYEVTTQIAASTDKTMVSWLDYAQGQTYSEESRKTSEEGGPAYISAATVSTGLSGDTVVISGNFTQEEAQQLADLLNSGSLNFKMSEIYSNVVSANLGEGSFEKTILAGGVAILAIMLFLIAIYRFQGAIASLSIAANTVAVLLIYTAMGGVFTLSGIAGLVLGIGMAVDSSVITFERIKDSLYLGRSVKLAYKEGAKKSTSTVFDAQATTLLSAAVLYIFGTGSVKGFATMLMVSTLVTIIFNVNVVRFLLRTICESGFLDDKKAWFGVNVKKIPNVAKGETGTRPTMLGRIDFIKNAKYFISISLLVFVFGVGSAIFNTSNNKGPFNLGIEFSSGTNITMTSKDGFKKEKLIQEFKDMGISVSDVNLSGDDHSVATISIKDAISEEQASSVRAYAKQTYNTEADDSTVSPIVGQELVKNAFIMSLLSWAFILLYVSIRFKWDYAISGIAALIHDVVIMLAFVAIFRLEVSINTIAVLLTIIGYSMNDTIVIFDRIRENVDVFAHRKIEKKDYYKIVNDSLSETIDRSIVTALTTIIPVSCLLIFGSGAIFSFNITLLIGLISGCVSSIFIAAQLWYVLRSRFHIHHKSKKKKVKKEKVQEHIIPGIND